MRAYALEPCAARLLRCKGSRASQCTRRKGLAGHTSRAVRGPCREIPYTPLRQIPYAKPRIKEQPAAGRGIVDDRAAACWRCWGWGAF